MSKMMPCLLAHVQTLAMMHLGDCCFNGCWDRGLLGFAKSLGGSGEASTSPLGPFGLQAHPRGKSNSKVRHINSLPSVGSLKIGSTKSSKPSSPRPTTLIYPTFFAFFLFTVWGAGCESCSLKGDLSGRTKLTKAPLAISLEALEWTPLEKSYPRPT